MLPRHMLHAAMPRCRAQFGACALIRVRRRCYAFEARHHYYLPRVFIYDADRGAMLRARAASAQRSVAALPRVMRVIMRAYALHARVCHALRHIDRCFTMRRLFIRR